MTAPSLPLHLGSDAEFTALREALAQAGFTESAVCWRLNLKRIADFPMDASVPEGPVPNDQLGALIWLLMYGLPIAPNPALPVAELQALGLVKERVEEHSASLVATVMLYPVRELWLVSDKPATAGDPSTGAFGDFVYPAIIPNTIQFLDYLPFEPCEAFLEVCAGTAPAALHAARNGARHAWAYDLTARSTHFAEFNRRLNGLANVTAAQGDLYEPAADLTFDRIVAHPPYMPVFRQEFIFNSGGQDGEQVVRGLVQGLPKHLRPGGRYYSLTLGSDREQPFEQRVRQWLGHAHIEFDVAFITRRTRSPEDYTSEVVLRRGGTMDDLRTWRAALKQIGVRQFAFGFLAIQRRAEQRPAFTIRRHAGPATSAAEHARLLAWETSLARDGAEPILKARPRTNPQARLRTEFRLTNEGWRPDTYEVAIEHPFAAELTAQAWAAHLLASADGTVTASELLEKLKAAGSVNPDTPPLEYAKFLALLVSGGFLELV